MFQLARLDALHILLPTQEALGPPWAMTIRSAAQAEASRLNGSLSSGPVSEQGMQRSSLNSSTHGLTARALLVPGEDAESYQAHVDAWVDALLPGSAPEAQLVGLIADLAWRLHRLQRLEGECIITNLDKAVADSGQAKDLVRTRDALEAVKVLAQTAASPHCATALEAEGGLDAFAPLVRRVAEVVRGADEIPADRVQALDRAMRELFLMLDDAQVLVAGLAAAALDLVEPLELQIKNLEKSLMALRENLASRAMLLDNATIRQLERHRRLIENSMARELAILGSVREQGRAGRTAVSGSLEPVVPVRLRVVK